MNVNNIDKILYIDMDEVICRFLDKLCAQCCEQGINIEKDNIDTWDLSHHIGDEGINLFLKPGFFLDLKPIDGALETMKELNGEGWEIFIISSPMNEHSVFEKYKWVKEYMDWFDVRNLILVGNKGDLLKRLNSGILFDDCGKYLEDFKKSNGDRKISVCMNRKYNLDYECDFRVESWGEFGKVVRGY